MEISLTVLQVLWYAILGVAVFAYCLGDGFDLGVSALYFLAEKEEEHRILLNSIGPVWDGNEVWLIIVFGGLFAGFPAAYGAILSIFYMPIWTMVTLYVLRGCSLEFRSKVESKYWKNFWDLVFCCSGVAIAFFLGSLAGSAIQGVPLAPNVDYAARSWILFLRPYSVLCGVLAIAVFTFHGLCFVLMKTTGALRQRLLHKFPLILSGFLVCYVLFGIASALSLPLERTSFQVGEYRGIPTYPVVTLLFALTLGACFAAKTAIRKNKFGIAFLYSSGMLLSMVLSAVTIAFPNLLLSTVDPQYSYTIYQSASAKTLRSLLMIVAVGLPFITCYFICIYRVFRGQTSFPSVY